MDNNHIKKIQNLGHLTNLEWLDLSFNQIDFFSIKKLHCVTLCDLEWYNQVVSLLFVANMIFDHISVIVNTQLEQSHNRTVLGLDIFLWIILFFVFFNKAFLEDLALTLEAVATEEAGKEKCPKVEILSWIWKLP